MKQLPWASYALIYLFFCPFSLMADDHVVTRQTRSYNGRTSRPRTQEVWICDNAVSINTGAVILIQRYDLGKTWMIFTRERRYLETPLPATAPAPQPEARIQERGFSYEPEFDWEAQRATAADTVNGVPCTRWTLYGEADYATEQRTLFVTHDVPINMERYWTRLKACNISEQLKAVFNRHPMLKSGFPLRSVVTRENAIAPTLRYHFDTLTLEKAQAPDAVYALPQGYTPVDTQEQLFAR